MNEERYVKLDRMRYTKNKLSSSLALLAIVFDVLYFVSIYQSDVGSWYYQILIGASVLYNLVFMLLAFLSSEGVKNYKTTYSYLLTALGVGQVVRMFILPAMAHSATVKIGGAQTIVMGNSQYAYTIICLSLSAVCCVASAVINWMKARQLAQHVASLEGQKA